MGVLLLFWGVLSSLSSASNISCKDDNEIYMLATVYCNIRGLLFSFLSLQL